MAALLTDAIEWLAAPIVTYIVRRRNAGLPPRPQTIRYNNQRSLSCYPMECMIIGAFGTRSSDIKAVEKKRSRPDGQYLRGVNEDVEAVQELIRKDPQKRLVYCCTDFPLALKPKREYFDKIKKFLKETKAPGGEVIDLVIIGSLGSGVHEGN